MNAYHITDELEKAVALYTGAPYCVCVSSCTDALELCVARLIVKGQVVTIPAKTYPSVPQVVVKHGGRLRFDQRPWQGAYALSPLPVWDCAKQFKRRMYVPGRYQCLSFHVGKILGDTQGGAILTDNAEDCAWFKRARFDGRGAMSLKDDRDIFIGFHCYMSPDVATRLLLRLQTRSFQLFDHQDQTVLEDEYSDLSTLNCFRPYLG